MMCSMNGLDRAISFSGGVTKLARLLGVRQSTVSNWRARGHPPAGRCRAIEHVTGGEVTAEELNPEVFRPVTETRKEAKGEAA